MFTAIKFKNYMSLKNLELSIQKGNDPKKIVAIYGENGSGKSNIVSAFMNLRLSLTTLENQNFVTDKSELLNSDDFDNDKVNQIKKFELITEVMSKRRRSKLASVFSNSYMLETEEPMEIEYKFQIDGKNGCYKLVFKKDKKGKIYLAKEKLYFLINKASGTLFEINNDKEGKININFSPQMFKSAKSEAAIKDDILRFWGIHTFLSIFNNFQSDNNSTYVNENVSNNFIKVIQRFKQISFRSDDANGHLKFEQLLSNLNKGSISIDESSKIAKTEKALMKYFIPLYSDIESMFYKKNNTENGEINYELYEKKRISNKLITIPFDLESNGTQRLLSLFPLFLNAIAGRTVIIDEIDQGIHDLLIERLIDNVREDLEGQLIFTTHDTQIMQQLDASSLYVLQVDYAGNKRIVNISKASQKNIAANNNIQKLYLNGYFSGIPYADDVDFYDILEDLGEDE